VANTERVRQVAINRQKVQDAAQKHWTKGNWERSLREYKKLVEDDPKDERSLQKVGDLYAKMKRSEEAVETYTAVARLYMEKDLHERASAVLRGAINHDPRSPELNRYLGEAYHRMGRLKDAVIWYNKAQELYREANDTRSQREVLERMVQLDPEDVGLRIRLAERYVKDGKSDDALAIFRYAANHFEDEGRFDDFAKVAERVVFLDASDAVMRQKIVQNAMDRQDYKRALRHLQVLFKADDKNQETLRTLAFVFRQMGNKEKAVQVYNHLAKVMWDGGQQPQAMRVWEQVLEIDPADEQAGKMVDYERKRRAAELKQEEAALRARGLDDSGSVPGLAPQTGNLGVRDSTDSPAGVVGEVEFLDDDLGDLLGGFASGPQRPVQQPAQQPAPQQVRQPATQPQREPAHAQQQTASDFQAFAQEAFGDFGGDIAFENLQALPGQPGGPPGGAGEPEPIEILDVEPIEELEVIPMLDAEPVEDPEVRKAIDEAKVFMKYGLRPKAIQSLITLIARFPGSEEAREELVGIYESQGEKNMAVDQLLELARLRHGRGQDVSGDLGRAVDLIGDHDYVAMMAEQMGLPMPAAPPAPAAPAHTPSFASQPQQPQEHAPFGQGGGFAFSEEDLDIETLHGLASDTDMTVDEGEILEIDDEGIELLDDDLIELDGDDLISEATDVDRPALWSHPNAPTPSGDSFGFTEDDADAMFDDLFADVAQSQQNVGMASLSSFGELGAEDQDAIGSIIDASLGGSRKLDVGNMRANENPFADTFSNAGSGAGFDSGPFDSVGISSTPSVVSIGEAVNTNFELGMAYMEMGNYAEALDEFRQAVDDPDVAYSASFNIANCEFRLGRRESARQRLERLLADSALPDRVRRQADRLMVKING
jgi:tetratricopeptide (TPR) repeat protein